VLNHIWQGIGFASVVIVVGFLLIHRALDRTIARLKRRLGYDSAGSIASVPLVLLFFSVYLFVIQPAQSGFSRSLEHDSDVFGMEAVGGGAPARSVAVTSFQKMAARNLSDPNPPAFIEWWLYSHPSVGRRIRFCAGQ
jgi:Zn-dependent protease with chaperone function